MLNTVENEKLAQWTIGFMSGTSVDAVDAAMIRTDGVRVYEFGPVAERKYTDAERKAIFDATAQAREWNWQGDVPHAAFREALEALTSAHIDAFNAVVEQCRDDQKPTLAGVHGQTLLHRAKSTDAPGATLQILDAQALREAFGVPLVYDFRTADVAAGGHGAPLAPAYHQALAREFDPPVAVLNLGGVANLTYIHGDEIFGFDCGPANGPIDEWVSHNTRGQYDADGGLAAAGTVHRDLLTRWMEHPFFNQTYPKSLDRYDFNASLAAGLSLEDGAATLTAFSAAAVASGLSLLPQPVKKVIVCGGGRHNPTLMSELNARCSIPVETAEQQGWRGDSIEAEAFALLAVRSVRDLPLSFPGTTGVPEPQTGGKLLD